MNFDYPDTELRFLITTLNGKKVFLAQFKDGGSYSAMCAMNASGVFSSIQMLYPQLTSWPAPGANEANLYDIFIDVLSTFDSLTPAYNYLENSGIKITHITGTTLHDFFSDKSGNACVVEVGKGNNLITKISSNYLVMTNFQNSNFVNTPVDQITGTGADRYKTAYKYLQEHTNGFTFENAIEVLQKTRQSSGSFATQVSFVFDPAQNEIYIMLKKDFTKIWKVSLSNETMETYSGFSQSKKMIFDSDGFLASELNSITSVNEKGNTIPDRMSLYQNYPNPFNPATTISYMLAEAGFVKLNIYDVLGREAATLVNSFQDAGLHTITWDGRNSKNNPVDSGVYLYCLEAHEYTLQKKMILMR